MCIRDSKEGFLRSETSLVQTIGRAARNADGVVILYADEVTPSMERAITETERRRAIQMAYNEAHGIVPKTIVKSIREGIEISDHKENEKLSGHRMSKAEREQLITCLLYTSGAVMVENGQITKTFGTFVNPGKPIPPKIVELTGINDAMVADAPSPDEAIKQFMEFAGDRVLIAHNAHNFDMRCV